MEGLGCTAIDGSIMAAPWTLGMDAAGRYHIALKCGHAYMAGARANSQNGQCPLLLPNILLVHIAYWYMFCSGQFITIPKLSELCGPAVTRTVSFSQFCLFPISQHSLVVTWQAWERYTTHAT
uniref:Uncharacterized protein n=1 Tax=Eutreptiella gymnastica TaxID=73025 RepID=A0A7S4FYV5_9EUGL|mmetsp:Transcript_1200/g.1907  ORF Transcript_1200/g.1907 Transcript_1200/m.1907 type:complete len:123 (+) Transcript_1200:375-743(+)